jgi:hypothetical protein
MATTIQVSEKLAKELRSRKLYENESYEDVIQDLLEDTMELSEQTKKHIEQSLKEIKTGKTVPLNKVKKDMGL